MSVCPYCNKGVVYYDAKTKMWRCTKCPATVPRGF